MSFSDRFKSFRKQVDDKTKMARVTGQIVVIAAKPGVGPVAESYLAPPPTPTEYFQQVVRDEQGQYKDWSQLQRERENSQLGNRPTEDRTAGPTPPRARPGKAAPPPSRNHDRSQPPAAAPDRSTKPDRSSDRGPTRSSGR